jgi:hypothetical protein
LIRFASAIQLADLVAEIGPRGVVAAVTAEMKLFIDEQALVGFAGRRLNALVS